MPISFSVFLSVLEKSFSTVYFCFFCFFIGQLNDTQQELKENNELVVELQGNLHLRVFLLNRPGYFFNVLLRRILKADKQCMCTSVSFSDSICWSSVY